MSAQPLLPPPATVGAICDVEGLHRQLAHWNRRRLAAGAPSGDWAEDLAEEHRMRWLEGAWVEDFREAIRDAALAAPTEAQAFRAWFEGLKDTGPGQFDPLFDWLARDASLADMKWFLTQEAAGEAGFDDLVALTQIKLPTEPKLELARNYWDEMGRGHAGGMHGPMLDRVVATLGLTPSIETTLGESLALANTMTALATTRRYAWQSVGALGIVELTAPTRVAKVADGLKRLGQPPVVRKYFELHAHLDVEHARGWIDNVLLPAVQEDPARAPLIAEGALMRLTCGQRCFDAYRHALWHGRAWSLAAE
jgi:hypothetical protein